MAGAAVDLVLPFLAGPVGATIANVLQCYEIFATRLLDSTAFYTVQMVLEPWAAILGGDSIKCC